MDRNLRTILTVSLLLTHVITTVLGLHHTAQARRSVHRHDIGSTPCLEGTFLHRLANGTNVCQQCTTCQPGFGVVQRCEGRHDTECEVCEPGKAFSPTDSPTDQCMPCRTCGDLRIISSQCTSFTNRVCGDCSQGYYLDDLTRECRKCSYCYPETPGWTEVAPGCATSGQHEDMRCYVSRPPGKVADSEPFEGTSSTLILSEINNNILRLTRSVEQIKSSLEGMARTNQKSRIRHRNVKTKRNQTQTWKINVGAGGSRVPPPDF